MWKRLVFPVLAILFLMSLSACIVPGSVFSEASTEIDLNLSDFSFEPERITVPAEEEITLNLSNSGTVEHDLTIMVRPAEAPFDEKDAAEIYFQAALKSGEKTTVSFTAPAAPGEYQIVSSLPGDLEESMVGTLVVVRP